MPLSHATTAKQPFLNAPFLTAQWRRLLMLNYEVDPRVLAPHVPAGTELDFFHGKTFVSLVAFEFLDTRVLGIPVPFHRDFEEINLRFYVRREDASETGEREVRRGVVFVREIVPRWAIATVARVVYDEPYIALPTRHKTTYLREDSTAVVSVEYAWKHQGVRHAASARTRGEADFPTRGSQEEFITEHYWGYTKRRDGTTSEYEVEHPPWRVWQVENPKLNCDVAALYGEEFAPLVTGEPSSAFLADGSEVTVRMGRRIAKPIHAAEPATQPA